MAATQFLLNRRARICKKCPVFNKFLQQQAGRRRALAYQAVSISTETSRHAESSSEEVETVTLKDLAAAMAETHNLPKAQANTMLTEMVASLGKHLKKGARIRISGLGILQVRKRAARMGRNPATGEAIKIKASKKIAFRASKDLKEAVM